MRILHYFLGFPPYRSGGLTKFAYDLMLSQSKLGHEIAALWPGKIGLFNTGVSIKKKHSVENIESYELINPLPVSLDEGILDTEAFVRSCEKEVFVHFLKEKKIDVIHIHTLMGLYREFVEAAQSLKIRTVFTSHDYFGLCPKVTMFRNGVACDTKTCSGCVECNKTALSLKKIMLMQSPLYRKLKNSALVKKMRNRHRTSFFQDDSCIITQNENNDLKSEKYINLRDYYTSILSKIDCVHFNSSLAENVYNRFFQPKSSKVISITHQNICDNRQKSASKQYFGFLRLTSLIPARSAKGFFVMKKALDELWEEGNHNFELNFYSSVPSKSPYMKIHEGRFDYSELEHIFSKTDVLLAPSVWYETFGFTVLEALSYGVPVVVSENVGAKDVVGSGGMIVGAGSIQSLKDAIRSLQNGLLPILAKNVQTGVEIKKWDKFLLEMESLYRECL